MKRLAARAAAAIAGAILSTEGFGTFEEAAERALRWIEQEVEPE